jgi:hypothetical protein
MGCGVEGIETEVGESIFGPGTREQAHMIGNPLSHIPKVHVGKVHDGADHILPLLFFLFLLFYFLLISLIFIHGEQSALVRERKVVFVYYGARQTANRY